jgi:hypothetical protein
VRPRFGEEIVQSGKQRGRVCSTRREEEAKTGLPLLEGSECNCI